MESIKEKFHTLIENIDNEQLLGNFYDLLQTRNECQDINLWHSLPEHVKEETLLALEESKDISTLTTNDEMKKRYSQWL